MYKIYLFLLSGLLLCGIYCSEAQELKTASYPDGTLRYKGFFKDGKPVGELLRYYPNGKISARMNHKGDTVEVVLYGRTEGYSSSGRYVHRKKEGEWKYFKNDRLLITEEYVNDRLHGKSCRYSLAGSLVEQKEWVNGQPQGVWTLYFDNGQLRMRASLLAGKLSGEVVSYDREGCLRSRGTYRADLKEGEWLFFDQAGKLRTKQMYRGGIREDNKEKELQESLELDKLLSDGKKIPDPAVFADDPEAYMKLTDME